jgi:hypothetical protein
MNDTKKNSNNVTGQEPRKPITLMVMGDGSAIIHPLFLHVDPNGFVHGIAVDTSFNTEHLILTLAEFKKTKLHLAKVSS